MSRSDIGIVFAIAWLISIAIPIASVLSDRSQPVESSYFIGPVSAIRIPNIKTPMIFEIKSTNQIIPIFIPDQILYGNKLQGTVLTMESGALIIPCDVRRVSGDNIPFTCEISIATKGSLVFGYPVTYRILNPQVREGHINNDVLYVIVVGAAIVLFTVVIIAVVKLEKQLLDANSNNTNINDSDAGLTKLRESIERITMNYPIHNWPDSKPLSALSWRVLKRFIELNGRSRNKLRDVISSYFKNDVQRTYISRMPLPIMALLSLNDDVLIHIELLIRLVLIQNV